MQLVGQVLQGTYQVERLIGEGGMGAVYEASHLRLNRRFAVKVLASAIAGSQEALSRFQREAMVTSGIGHPNILDVIDFNHTTDGVPYIIMEFLEGENLAERLARVKRFDVEQATLAFKQAASALYAAHQKGVVHRDLKPQNLFLCTREDGEETLKVIDFGISKILGATSVLTEEHSLIGTPFYMSPEQIEHGSAGVDPRADVYAMGVILYEMLEGKLPFQGDSVPNILYKIIHREPPPFTRSDLPPPAAEVVMRALSKRPEHRYDSMKAFWDAFAEAVGFTGDFYLAKVTGVSTVAPADADASTEAALAPTLAPLSTLSATASEVRGRARGVTGTWIVGGAVALALVVTGAVLAFHYGSREAVPPAKQPPVAPAGSRAEPDAAPRPPVATAPRTNQLRPLWLASNPPGADVLVDGVHVGKTPVLGVGITVGKAEVTLRRHNYKEHSLVVEPGTDTARLGSVELTPLRARQTKAATPAKSRLKHTATLQVSTLSQGESISADLYLNGKRLGQSPFYRDHMAPGTYTIEARHADYRRSSRTVKLMPGRETSVVLELRR